MLWLPVLVVLPLFKCNNLDAYSSISGVSVLFSSSSSDMGELAPRELTNNGLLCSG